MLTLITGKSSNVGGAKSGRPSKLPIPHSKPEIKQWVHIPWYLNSFRYILNIYCLIQVWPNSRVSYTCSSETTTELHENVTNHSDEGDLSIQEEH